MIKTNKNKNHTKIEIRLVEKNTETRRREKRTQLGDGTQDIVTIKTHYMLVLKHPNEKRLKQLQLTSLQCVRIVGL